MGVVVECNNNETGPKNTGAKEQCYLGVTTKYAFSPDINFGFENITALKSKEAWNTAIANKEIYPLYEVEEYAIADTEDTFYEGSRKQYKTADGKKVRTFRTVIGLCSYSALESHSGKEGRVFEFTEDPGIKAVQHDEKIKGQKAILNVGNLQDTIAGTPQSCLVTVNYTDKKEYTQNGVNVQLEGWGDQDIFGIFDLNLIQVSASSASIKFKASTGCGDGNSLVKTLLETDIQLKDVAGAVHDISFIPADANGVYEVTGTGFTNGFTLATTGVVKKVNTAYESPEPLLIKIA